LKFSLLLGDLLFEIETLLKLIGVEFSCVLLVPTILVLRGVDALEILISGCIRLLVLLLNKLLFDAEFLFAYIS